MQQQAQPQHAADAGSLTRDDLLDLLVRYNEATDRLRASHESLRSEVARLTAELEQKNHELERRERLAMLGEMAAGVAHEIRNPLGGISLYADMLLEDLGEAAEQRDIVRQVQGGIRVLNRIVEDMLLFARDLQVDARAHDLGRLVRGSLELARHDVARSGLHVAADHARLDVELNVDGSLVTRALLNMILNAAQAAEGRSGAALCITAGPAPQNGFTQVVLEDTCGGIDRDDLSRIFNPFFTRRDQGTGLGLAIVHRTVEAHGGWIAAANNTVGGATFTFTLPQVAVGAQDGPPAAVPVGAARSGDEE